MILMHFTFCVQMIPPRGCAYIVMVHRQDAYTALNKLSRGSYKVNQKPVKVCNVFNFHLCISFVVGFFFFFVVSVI